MIYAAAQAGMQGRGIQKQCNLAALRQILLCG